MDKTLKPSAVVIVARFSTCLPGCENSACVSGTILTGSP